MQRLGGGQTSCRPFFLTTSVSRVLTYLFDATPPETTCIGRTQDEFLTPMCTDNHWQENVNVRWIESNERKGNKRNCAAHITKCLMDGSIFNAHSIARSHLSSRWSTATRCNKFHTRINWRDNTRLIHADKWIPEKRQQYQPSNFCLGCFQKK